MHHVIPCLLCTVYTFPDVSPCRHYSPGTYHKNTTTTAALFRVFMSRYPQHRAGGMAAPCLARHTAVLVAAHVAIRHLTTSDCIRSTADTITAAHQAGHVPHVLTSHTAFRPHSNFQLQHVRPRSRQNFRTRTRPHERTRRHGQTDTKNTHGTAAAASGGHAHRRPPLPHVHHGHNCSGHGQTFTTDKKSPSRLFPCGAILSYSAVTIFTISSAVFPSRARTNFDFASERFTSGMCFSASWSNLASPGVNLFNLSKTAKQ